MMKFQGCRIIKSKPVRDSGAFSTYPVMHHDMLMGAKIAKGKKSDFLLKQNASAQISLVHQDIVPVFELGWCEDRGSVRPFALTKYTDKPNMQELISRKKLSLDQKLEIMLKLTDALKYAHSKGQPHGNIRETNVFADVGFASLDNFGISVEPFYASPEYEENHMPSEKSDVFSLTQCFWNLLNEKMSKYTNIYRAESWPGSLPELFESGLAVRPEDRRDIGGLQQALQTVRDEYRAFLTDLPVGEDNCLDVALAYKREGRTDTAITLLEIAAMFFRNDKAVEELARCNINLGRLEKTFELIKDQDLPNIHQMLLEAALIKEDKMANTLIKGFGFQAVMNAYAQANHSNYPRIKGKTGKDTIVDNDFAIAAAIYEPGRAAGIFQALLGNSDDNVVYNNLGAAAAIQASSRALDYLNRSSLESARLNKALFCFSQGDYKQAIGEAENVRNIPKAGAMIKAVNKALGIRLPISPHPEYAMETLTDRISERFVKEGILPADYEFARMHS